MVFFTQITMEAAEDPAFLDAMREARIRGALVGVESVTAEGLKDVYKGFNLSGDELVERLRAFRRHGVHVLGLVHLRPAERSRATRSTPPSALAKKADLTFAQFVLLTPFPGTLDFEKWAASPEQQGVQVDGDSGHAALADPARAPAQALHAASDDGGGGDPGAHAGRVGPVLQLARRLGALARRWSRSRHALAFVLISKLYRQMYANTGIATDSARVARSARMARLDGDDLPRVLRGRADARPADAGHGREGSVSHDRHVSSR